MSNVTIVTPDELRVTRARLLEASGMSEEELRRRGRAYQLDLEEIGILDEIDQIDYLLSE